MHKYRSAVRRMTRFLAALAVSLGLAGCLANAQTSPLSVVPPGGAAEFKPTYFGMHIHEATTFGHWPPVTFGAWRLWDARVQWPELEPAKGKWQFELLDAFVARAQGYKVELLLPLGRTPAWASARPNEPSAYGPGQASEPRDLQDWRTYVRAVASRYRGRIAAYEIWNEVTEPMFWSGSTEKLVELTRIAREELKAIDPDAILVAPSSVGMDRRTASVRKFLDSGGAGLVDVVSYHFYHGPHPPEAHLAVMQDMRAQLARAGFGKTPLWNTESGYWIEPPFPVPNLNWNKDELESRLSEGKAADLVVRDLVLARALGFERFYWYAWDNKKMGLIEPSDLSIRRAGIAFGEAASLLANAVLRRCDRDASGVWACSLSTSRSTDAYVLWVDPASRQQASRWMAPADGAVSAFDGAQRSPLSKGQLLELGARALLFEAGAR